jgi:diguanylate cyclase (GGDEF)-like protein
LLGSLHGYALGGSLDPGQLSRMPEELQPLAGGIGDLAGRMNAAFGELRQVLDQRERVIEERTESLRQAVSDLDRLSRTDALTGSLNYRGFLEAGAALWQQARATGAPLSVLALDIDHFKRYNDLYGHAEGDGALRRFAGAVSSALLHADDVLARPGGEEFIVFLPGSSFEQAMKVAQRVCERVRAADIVHAASPEGRMTVSIGVASMQAGDGELEQLLRRADAALYRAKAAGRNRACD